MGPAQNLLTWVGSIFCCLGQVGLGQPSLVWVWKISPKTNKFFNFLPFESKKQFGSGQKVSGSKARRPLIYCGSKVCSGRFRSGQGPSLLAWLSENSYFKDIRRLNSVHYRVAVKDYKRRRHRWELDGLGRARPSTWSKYALATTTIKTIQHEQPQRLREMMMTNSYMERRRPGRFKFYDGSKMKIGRQMIDNRLSFMNELDFNWTTGITNNLLRINLKKHFRMAAHQVVVFPLGGA